MRSEQQPRLGVGDHHNKEKAMDTSNGAEGVTGLPSNDATERVKESARSAVDTTKQAAQEKLSEGASRVADSAKAAASSLRRAADDVQGEHAWIGTALRKSADGIEGAAQSLRGGDINRALGDLNAFARRQPTLFLGGSIALGFMLARVGKTAMAPAADSMQGLRPADSSTPNLQSDIATPAPDGL
jgi:hypothetical protein